MISDKKKVITLQLDSSDYETYHLLLEETIFVDGNGNYTYVKHELKFSEKSKLAERKIQKEDILQEIIKMIVRAMQLSNQIIANPSIKYTEKESYNIVINRRKKPLAEYCTITIFIEKDTPITEILCEILINNDAVIYSNNKIYVI